jgi:ElaB/YqjD/DUF883 family membrane-anchored ribosome-binding protein
MSSEDLSVYENHVSSGNADTNGNAGVLQSLREGTRVTTEAFCDIGHKASVTMTELGDSAYRAGKGAGARVAGQVKAQPMTAALIAASVGLIIGVLLPRR